MATRCQEHAYVDDGVSCPYCEVKLLHEKLGKYVIYCDKLEKLIIKQALEISARKK